MKTLRETKIDAREYFERLEISRFCWRRNSSVALEFRKYRVRSPKQIYKQFEELDDLVCFLANEFSALILFQG